MAHRSNLIQVARSIESSDLPRTVQDPVCHVEILRKLCKHVLVRGEESFYFCSRECLDQFVHRQYRPAGKGT